MIQILQLGAAERVAQKAAHMAEVDPSGLILTLVSVSVVFGALIILFGAYSLSGYLFTKEQRESKNSGGSATEEEAAAVAVALDMYLSQQSGSSDEEAAAIAVALDRYLDEEAIHDIESGIITIKR